MRKQSMAKHKVAKKTQRRARGGELGYERVLPVSVIPGVEVVINTPGQTITISGIDNPPATISY